MTRKIQNEESLSIELDEEDLLDIDGSDDPTAAFSGKAVLSKLHSPKKKVAARQPQVASMVVDDPTIVIRDDIRETIPFPKALASKFPFAPPAAHAPINAKMAPKSPTISPAPPVRNRNANSSYPPIAISVPPARDRQMSFISEKPSRAGWIAAAVLGVLIVVGGSLKVAAPKAAAPAADPTPVAAAEPPPAPEETKVVTFGENQGVNIKPKADAKADAKDAKDAKPEPKKPAHVWVAPAKPAAKPASSAKVDNSLAVTKETKEEKKDIPSTSHDATPSSGSSNMSKADQKKLKSIEQDLADLQLKAAAR